MDRLERSSRVGPGSGARRRSRLPGLVAILLLCLTAACSATPPATGSPPAGSAAPTASSVAAGSPVAIGSPSDTVVLVGAGDIAACDGPASESVAAETAALVAAIPGIVFTAGDDAYEDGSAADFRTCYDPTWGAFKDRTLLPAIGNHEFKTPGGAGYFEYFGARAGTPGEGWYSADVGAWHVVVLDANCTIVGCGPGSAQYGWLIDDLRAHPALCTLAIWHQPRFSSGLHHDDPAVAPFWDALSAAHADLVINGHDHDYERFAPQSPDGRLDPSDGIREIVVGTGGAALRPFTQTEPNREAASDDTHGVLVLTLHPASYDWRFVPVAGSTFTDSGSADCH